MATAPTFVGTPSLGLVQILPADASGQKTVVTAGASGTKVTSLVATSTDTASRILQVSIARSATNYIIGTVSIPANSGTDGTIVSVDLLNTTQMPGLPLDNDGQKYLFLKSGDTLQVSATTTVTAAKIISLSSVCGDF